tara:strand:+ start:465 stop:632 length:168 start_codon:yes stop_codon:yes gene_type:complete
MPYFINRSIGITEKSIKFGIRKYNNLFSGTIEKYMRNIPSEAKIHIQLLLRNFFD